MTKRKENLTTNISLPVTIITGFLGSGKTTLLNHILSNQQGVKTAVLVNEFGEIGIDNDLIMKTEEDMIELNNGCICCSINGELLKSVETILERKDSIDYLIVETTGLADPLPVAMTFVTSKLRELTRLDSIITVVDAENFNDELISSQIGRNQIIYGDILLLNKCDLVSDEKISLIDNKLREIKKHLPSAKDEARILKCSKGNVHLGLLLSVGLFETDYLHKKNDDEIHDHSNCDHENGSCNHEVSDGHGHGHLNEENNIDGYTSVSYKTNDPFSLLKFQDFLDNHLPSEVFRAKGILWFNESERKHVFHLAGKRFSIEDFDWDVNQKNQIVLIGRNLDHDKIKSQLKSCVAKYSD